ncbi:TLC domain-containing protein 4-B-like [Lolium rigidum]|uniref:TLC domain-containing protein 4-B-like n=1 Tax=Lolium rigidum TaxID=89674 RepID=UPI001F5C698B|nr:TLC domain-containing protein 4-B-like [Lolium rigidum]
MDWSIGPEEQVLWPASVLAGVVMCGAVYETTRQISSRCFKCYDGLSPMQKVEWNNRGFSTFHALVAAAVSFYVVMVSGLFSEDINNSILIGRKSWLSDSMFGVSIGYFLTDLAMILWYFPSLGGKEFLLHHGLSMYAIGLALFSGKAHMYILMVLFTEATTPFVNLRWYLDVAGQKTHRLYLCNGLALFVGWLVARIILFVYFFSHMYFHFDQVKSIFALGFYSIMTVPPTIAAMNVFWFWKISKGMVKTLCKSKSKALNGNGKTD